MQRIAIIGAGVSGLVAAQALRNRADVTVFEKSRGVSGRVSTRYADPYSFNHGAQFFTARSKLFKVFLRALIKEKLVKAWQPKVVTLKKGEAAYSRKWFEPHYVACPHMNSFGQNLAKNSSVFLKVEIKKIKKKKNQWHLTTAEGQDYGPFDWVVLSVPAPQARVLMPQSFSGIEIINQVRMKGCFTLMIGLRFAWPFAWSAATVKDSLIGWIAVQSLKVDRQIRTSIVVHSTNEWADKHTKKDLLDVQSIMISELEELLPSFNFKYDFIVTHGWRYAATEIAAGCDYLIDSSERLAACGDWCRGDRIEDGFLSGTRLAKRIMTSL